MLAMLRWAAVGILYGILVGVVARVFMRLVSPEPEFSWGGTLGIITFAAAYGLGLGVVRGARLGGRSHWWRLVALLGLPWVALPQGVMSFLPAALGGGWGLSGRGPRLLRIGAVLVGLLAGPIMIWVIFTPEERAVTELVDLLVLAICNLLIAGGGAQLFRRWPQRRTRRSRPADPMPALLGS